MKERLVELSGLNNTCPPSLNVCTKRASVGAAHLVHYEKYNSNFCGSKNLDKVETVNLNIYFDSV